MFLSNASANRVEGDTSCYICWVVGGYGVMCMFRIPKACRVTNKRTASVSISEMLSRIGRGSKYFLKIGDKLEGLQEHDFLAACLVPSSVTDSMPPDEEQENNW